jgi:hypothetical protein
MRRWSLVRLVAVAAVLTTAAVTVTACGAPTHGLTGVMINSSGRLTAVLGWCPGHEPDGLTLYTENERSAVGVADWEADRELAGRYAELPLDRLKPGWRAIRPLPRVLEPRREYTLYGWTRDNPSSTEHVYFTMDALRTGARGTILVPAGHRDENGHETFLHVGPAEFQHRVRAHFGC